MPPTVGRQQHCQHNLLITVSLLHYCYAIGGNFMLKLIARYALASLLIAALVASVSSWAATPTIIQAQQVPTPTPTPAAGTCTVNAAGGATYTTIQAAVSVPSCTTINVAAGTYLEHDITLTHDVSIIGAGRTATIVDGQRNGRVFDVAAGVRATIQDLTVQGGLGSIDFGGGIRNAGDLSLSNCNITQNAIGASGGGIGNRGQLEMDRCNVFGNSSIGSSGIYNIGNMTVTRSAIYGNFASFSGGISTGESGFPNASLLLGNVTVAENVGGSDSTQIDVTSGTADIIHGTIVRYRNLGFAIRATGGLATLFNTLVSSDPTTTTVGSANCFGAISNGSNNLSSDDSCNLGESDVADPRLDPSGLRDNGGETFTYALLPNSPAIDAANFSNCGTTDQRGVARSATACDIGAFERRPEDEIPPTTTPALTATPQQVTPTPTQVPPTPTATPTSSLGSLNLQINIYIENTRTPLSNWEVQVFDMADGENIVAQGNTDASGVVTFNIPQGFYKICQTLQGGWLNLAPTGSCYWQTLTGITSKSLSFVNRQTGATSTPTPVVTATPSGVCVPLSRSGWLARSSYNGDVALAIDGSTNTFWNNGINLQGQGHWFSVDLGSIRDVSQITLNTTADPNNYARKFDVFTSVSGGSFALVGSTTPTGPITSVRFPSRKARYISVQIAQSNFTASWSIGDFDICNGGPTASLNASMAAEVFKLDVSTRIHHVFLPTVFR
jgi:hypothetical protein